MPPTADLSNEQARALALRAQSFGTPPRHAVDLLDRLGVIQLDSVNVLARSHELIPFSRMGPYSVPDLYADIYGGRHGFEYWGHEASWLPMQEYRYFTHRMQRRRLQQRPWWAEEDNPRQVHADLYAGILDRLRTEGPLSVNAFADDRDHRGTWWDWKPAKRVLEDLFDQGHLTSAGRQHGFARVYDLADRYLPPTLNRTDPGPETAARHLLMRGVAALGVGTATDASDYFRLKPADWQPALAGLLGEGALQQVTVEGWRQPGLVIPGTLDGPLTVPRHHPAFLSPFDNLIWERKRTERLFGFAYRLEIYVPQPKRVHGYYVLPLLARGRLGGRADLKLDRQHAILRVHRIQFEGATPRDAARALKDLAVHLHAGSIEIGRVEPAKCAEPLSRLLADPPQPTVAAPDPPPAPSRPAPPVRTDDSTPAESSATRG